MSTTYEKYQKRKLISSYFSVIFSMFLVLFILGALGLFVVNSKKIANKFRETIPMTVYFKSSTQKKDIDAFDAFLHDQAYLKKFDYVSKEEAANTLKADLGEDFLNFLGENPLEDSFDIYFNNDYVNTDSISKIENTFLKQSINIQEITYDKELVTMVNDNIALITKWILIIAGVLTLISMLLINSSLRLLIHSSRFTIKTMQMVGATKSFIRRPFILHNIKLGLISAILANTALVVAIAIIDKKFPDLDIQPFVNYIPLATISIGLIVLSFIITAISTYFATQRFLNLKSEDLY